MTDPIQNISHIFDLVTRCAKYGVEKAVVCPGSRCAPLLIGFGQHPAIETISVTDERSAGYVGLGFAQQSDKPVVLVCTSGTAAQNFIPAVTEAFYQQVPLIVITADRPSEWIDQWDGQTIHQNDLFEPHIKGSYVYSKDQQDVSEEAFSFALSDAKGPVHLNVPIDEPFYPNSLNDIKFSVDTKRDHKTVIDESISDDILDEFSSILRTSEKVMIIGGQLKPDDDLIQLLNQVKVTVVGDVISNLHGVDGVIKSADMVFNTNDESFSPDFLITIGRSVISKKMKLFLRKNQPKVHWHIGNGMVGDPYQSITKIIKTSPVHFFKRWLEQDIHQNNSTGYRTKLSNIQKKVDTQLSTVLDHAKFNYFTALETLIKTLPENSVLHLGNSMPVRIVNYIGMNDPTIDIWCNRGTSGIDGVVSTAVGHAIAEPNRKHTLIVGDLSFFYDRNGLWLNHEFPTNLQIVVLNDFSGGIFNMILGPSNQGELLDLFTVPHKRTAKLTAKEFGLAYHLITSLEEIKGWFSGIMEIFTDSKINKDVYKKITTIGGYL